MDQVRALPPLPAAYSEEPSLAARLTWVQLRLIEPISAAERYRVQRAWFFEHVESHRGNLGRPFCTSNPPLREDINYRAACLKLEHPNPEQLGPHFLALAREAKELGEGPSAAALMQDLAWMQSEAGDVGAAFASYELALSYVPQGRGDLLANVMLDTATAYIVNGDESYVHKGLNLLRGAREQRERLLAEAQDRAVRAQLRDDILLTRHNEGVAYLLHLDNPEQALTHFDLVTREPNSYRESAISFAAFAAAEIGQFERARAYLNQAERSRSEATAPVVDQYLACYRQLARRRMQPGLAVPDCLRLRADTPSEVQLDLYKRLSANEDAALSLAGLKGLAKLFTEKLEPQLRSRGSQAASNAELMRLQRESELKSLVLKQQTDLQRERERATQQQRNYFIALSLVLLLAILLIGSRWLSKKKLAEQFEHLSQIDTLTQLGNRRFLEQRIERELSYLQRARRKDEDAALGIYLFDIDHFKAINDQHGHAVGDQVLVTFGRRLRHALRDTDLLVRWGGEEILLVARLDHAEHCSALAERLLHAIVHSPFDIEGGPSLGVSCTVGVLALPFLPGEEAQPWAALVGLTDLALYEGKAQGRRRWVQVHNLNVEDAEALALTLRDPLRDSVAAGRLRITVGSA
ncbi:diguanylate cyclase (GGDEF)-like protein [Inhella inkyongensis]|uniref:diguanylate cyclase n=1 Tax=Inhella inkyongensis TaxID=392593 RepID=A0A840S8J1_9BURK|nr:GGDEF domain-containing protein [Inhella inkyongensis]MBB5204861.1 diguanylate cyclase (GGDEF)-like protein [Inhella inkyongensis]